MHLPNLVSFGLKVGTFSWSCTRLPSTMPGTSCSAYE